MRKQKRRAMTSSSAPFEWGEIGPIFPQGLKI
jgi:hypothetical protein